MLKNFYKNNYEALKGAGLDAVWLAIPAAIVTTLTAIFTHADTTNIGLHLLLFGMLAGFLRRKVKWWSIPVFAAAAVLWELAEVSMGFFNSGRYNDYREDLLVDTCGFIGSWAAELLHGKLLNASSDKVA